VRRRRTAVALVATVVTAGTCGGSCAREPGGGEVGATPERIARGEYLVNHVTGCGACHTPRDTGNLGDPERRDEPLAGGNVLVTIEPGMRVPVPNITPDRDTGIGRWSDAQVIRAIRDGVDDRGRGLLPQMPFASFRHMSDDDVRAVVAYLRTVPACPEPPPREKAKVSFVTRALATAAAALRPLAQGVTAPPRSDLVRYGEYVAHLATCSDCHSLSVRGPRGPGDRFLAGSDVPFPEGGSVYAPNITPDPVTGIGSFSREQVKRAIREGVRFDGKRMAPPMATVAHDYAGMAEEDLDALVAYLFAQQPVSHRVPERKLRPAVQARLGER
jgi:mono/diheme cytochrome c family protein